MRSNQEPLDAGYHGADVVRPLFPRGAVNALVAHVRNSTGEDVVTVGDDIRRRLFASVFVAAVVPFVLGFAVQDLFQGNVADALAELGFLLIMFALVVLVLRLRQPRPIYLLMAGALTVMLLYLAANPEIGAERLFWFYLYVPFVTFTLGRLYGAGFGVLLLGLLAIMQYAMPAIGPRAEATVFVRFVATYTVLGMLVYAAEYARERTQRSLIDEHQELLQAHGEIRRLSVTDTVTQTFNRHYLSNNLPGEIERAKRYRRSLAVILCDIDHFKKLNDTAGHTAGDAVLRTVADTLAGLVRTEIDWVARYGGEEFLIVLPETELAGAESVAERLRRGVEELRVPLGDQTLSCTVSFGVAEWHRDLSRPEDLINQADSALYQAKARGRNRVEVARRRAG